MPLMSMCRKECELKNMAFDEKMKVTEIEIIRPLEDNLAGVAHAAHSKTVLHLLISSLMFLVGTEVSALCLF
jgi:putative heme iron utilization protein